MVEVTINFLYQVIGELQVEKRALEVQLSVAQKAAESKPESPAKPNSRRR